MDLILPDSVIAREKSEILVEYLHKVFCERCGMNLKIELQFEEAPESRYRKNAALQIQQEVENVLKNAKLEGEEEPKETEEEEKKDKKDKKDHKKSGDKGHHDKKSFDKKARTASSVQAFVVTAILM